MSYHGGYTISARTVALGCTVVLLVTGLWRLDLSNHRRTCTSTVAVSGDAAFLKLQSLYLHTVKTSVTGFLLQTPGFLPGTGKAADLVENPFDEATRTSGLDWPVYGITMAGLRRMDNVQDLITRALTTLTPGDFVETGTWRGGSSIFAKAVFTAHHADRQVHVVDSFQGLPASTTTEDAAFEDGLQLTWSNMSYLAVSQEEVAGNFERYQLLDDQVQFHRGYFRSSMPILRDVLQKRGRKLAIMRMDGDMFESTLDVLFNLYDLLSQQGFVIVDDWLIPVCEQAVRKFFELHDQPLPAVHPIDATAVWFQKETEFPLDMDWYQNWNKTKRTDNLRGNPV